MDQKTKEIQMSVAFNNASRIMAGNVTGINKSLNSEKIVEAVDLLARQLYEKQIKFLEEINKDENKSHK